MLKNSDIMRALKTMPSNEREQLLKDLEDLDEARTRKEAQLNFLPFVKAMWPAFVEGRHHRIMAEALDDVASGKLKRLIINLGPRHTKSEFGSFLFPAWFMGRFPDKKIIQASNTGDLAVAFGRKVKNLIDTEDYQNIFPGTKLAADAKAAGRWATTKRGEYFAIGTGGTVTGKGADVLIIDDPHSEQDAKLAESNPAIYDQVYEWYTSGPRQRLQPGGAIILIQTRWSKRDLTGQIVRRSIERSGTDEWKVIELPAILPSGEPLWPEFWSLSELMATKAEIPLSKWNAQYMQTPTAEEGALIKRDWWKVWLKVDPPKCEAVIQSWDTAFEKTQRADYSACTTWGVFYWPDDEGKERPNVILLDAYKAKLEFPDLKKKAQEKYREFEPDQLVIEKKASGAPLIYELRAMGLPVTEFTPTRGNDKIARVNAISDLFSSGVIWAPDKRWAEEVIEECAAFPAGDHDDFVDSASAALIRFRQGGWIRIDSDEEDDKDRDHQPAEYY
jgi:predicted phage terminase large subunit-like protein